ncbi:hypothetical protein BV22DRAFT_1036976 [Leucogyrophana mollusca]|uniref:Uncharacterized protein n=1 Tax=Leucogyrophana mollusca TaxID=85980 RepID=A0ACB8BB44_9AGAM|nr:hypothetical protein BV22DRAFT_1036976 [Leucogyrophana mollusca]
MSRSSTEPTETVRDVRKNIFGSAEPVPRWVPVTLLAVSSIALVVPVILLKRYRNGAGHIVQQANAPPRRGGSSTPFIQASPRQAPVTPPLPPPSPPKLRVSKEGSGEDFFNAPLYTLKAFGIATALVTAGATISIWGVKTFVGANDTKEFADRMRHAMLTKMPILSSRIHRPPDLEENGNEQVPPQSSIGNAEWNWSDAENRLKEAFDKGGFYGWATAAAGEVEAEAQVERAKRQLVDRVAGNGDSP